MKHRSAARFHNSRPIYDYTEEQERAYWQDFITHLKEVTGKRLKGTARWGCRLHGQN